MVVHKEYYWHERGYRYVSDDLWLDKFIEDLTNNKDCNYNEIRYVDEDNDHGVWDDFDIEHRDGIIRIYNEISEISLIIESKDRVIKVLKNYRDQLAVIKVLKNYRDQLAAIGGCSCS